MMIEIGQVAPPRGLWDESVMRPVGRRTIDTRRSRDGDIGPADVSTRVGT